MDLVCWTHLRHRNFMSLDDCNRILIEAATDLIRRRYDPSKHVVAAALRLKTGEVVTGVHLEATVGRIAVCAEAVAIGRSVTELGNADIETIVAVYHPSAGEAFVCSPCGMCRELISDYAPQAHVLMDQGGEIAPIPVSELLPSKFRRAPGHGSTHGQGGSNEAPG